MSDCSPPNRAVRRWHALVAPAALVFWLVLVVLGMRQLVRHQFTPGDPGLAVERWPATSALKRHPGQPAVVLSAHPKCPCTRASIEQLARILARAPGVATVYVLFYGPAGSDEWRRTDIVRSAQALPGVSVVHDEEGREAQRFGTVTSGQTVLYDGAGRLVFRGGITGSRGHAGDNPGQAAVVSFLTAGAVPTSRTPTFGCALFPAFSR